MIKGIIKLLISMVGHGLSVIAKDPYAAYKWKNWGEAEFRSEMSSDLVSILLRDIFRK